MALDRYELAARIRRLLDPELAAIGLELLEVRIFRGGGRLQVRVYVDAPGGVDLENCARASRTIDPLLEESGLVEDRYVIEISSPGVRRPLRKPEHFQRHLGQTIEIRGGGSERPWRLRGVLLAADEAGLTVQPLAAAGAAPAGGDLEQDESLEAEEAAAAQAAASRRPSEGPATGEGTVEEGPAEEAPVAEALPPRTVAHADILEASLDPEYDPRSLIQADRRRRKLERREERQERRQNPRRRQRRQGPAGDG